MSFINAIAIGMDPQMTRMMDVTADGEFLAETAIEWEVVPACLSIYAPSLKPTDTIGG